MAEHAYRLAAKASERFTPSPRGERDRRAPTLETNPIRAISRSRTAVRCQTRTSPDFAFDNDSGFVPDTISVWAAVAIHAIPFST